VVLVRKDEASPVELVRWKPATSGTICKYIHLQGARSCQLVMGVTHLSPGSNWNTMPPHTHMRRSEIYMYFNVQEDARVVHLMGPPEETRHVLMGDKDVVVSPGWSIHAAWALGHTVSAGAWAGRTKTMRIWICAGADAAVRKDSGQ